jgi:hypothetical protein
MFTAQSQDTNAWQTFLSYQKRPGRGSNGLITTTCIITMPDLPAVTSIFLLKPFIAGKGVTILGIQGAWRIALVAPGM